MSSSGSNTSRSSWRVVRAGGRGGRGGEEAVMFMKLNGNELVFVSLGTTRLMWR